MQTPAAFDFWCYILITWHPQTGLQFYGNSNLKTSLTAPQANPAPVPVYSGKPNFAVGRGLNQDLNQMCGLVYMSSIAVFKQHLTQEWVNKVFGFFWKNSKWICFLIRCSWYSFWLAFVYIRNKKIIKHLFTRQARSSFDELVIVIDELAHSGRIIILRFERGSWRNLE